MTGYICTGSTDSNTDTTVWISDGDTYHYYVGPYQRQYPPTVDRFTPWGTRVPFGGYGPCSPCENENEGKEETEMVGRQTFLDALVVEGRQVTAEELEVVREASASKWALFVATLLARVFETSDLELLEEKPKEVVILKEKA